MAGSRLHLDPDDHPFLAAASALIMANPFEVTRQQVAALVPTSALAAIGDSHPMTALLPALTARLDRLIQRNAGSLAQYAGEERQWLADAWLFRGYHRFLPELDRLIEREVAHPNPPATVSFADEALALLREQGFSEAEATRYFGLFYQLRRAYYFIDGALIGPSPCMGELRRALWNNVFGRDMRVYERYLWNRMEDFSTLLLGETGSGKGSAAAAIGRSVYIPFDPASNRFRHSFTDTFIAVNLVEFPESLIESELFGHRKGAFTGAVDDHQGVFARCSPYGSLFLDEIGDASLGVQIKLLRVLQERIFTPVGSHKPQRFSGRVIAATHQSLAELRQQRKFREDFFYRLCSDVITVPPLRQRLAETPAELDLLVHALVTRLLGAASPEADELVLTALRRDLPADYAWPGNVRELEQAVRRILLTGRYDGEPAAAETDFWRQAQAGMLDARGLLAHYCTLLYQRCGNYEEVARRTGLDRRTVRKYLQAALARNGESQH
jgi:sigma-54 specific flagellar transcriptional regulator A